MARVGFAATPILIPVSKLKLLHPILKAKEKFRGLVDVQIVAFPQLGLIADPQSVDLMRAAMREGADVVGGMPHAEAFPRGSCPAYRDCLPDC